MTTPEPKDVLLRYLRTARDALAWKLEGLSDRDVRRPMTPTGTNLLGLVKHVAGAQAGYLGDVLGRPFPEPMRGYGPGEEPNADLFATEAESREDVLAYYRRSAEHADASVAALPLDAPGVVPWWPPERRDVTLEAVLVHVIAEINRHAGHADIVRELLDGSVGLNA